MSDQSEAVRVKHVYENGVTEWFVAESAEQASELCKKMNIELGHHIPEDELDLTFTQTPDDKVLTMADYNRPLFSKPETVTQTAAEFAAENEPGFLGTTEY